MEYTDFLITRFAHWSLYLHVNQYPYVGRCYAWANRDADGVLSMNTEECSELFGKVLPLWSEAIKSLYGNDAVNVSCFGNNSPHLHWHFIPRYLSPVTFHGIEFVDPRPSGNYAPYQRIAIDKVMLMAIRDEIGITIGIKP